MNLITRLIRWTDRRAVKPLGPPKQIIDVSNPPSGGSAVTKPDEADCLPLTPWKQRALDNALSRSWPVVMYAPESRPIEELQAQVEVLIEEVEMLKQAHFRSQGEL